MPIISGSGGGSSGGGLLAFFQQTAGTNQGTTSATLVDVDATNAAVTFTAPASGKVMIRCSAIGVITNVNVNCLVGLREATTIVAGPTVALQGNITNAVQVNFAVPLVVTGVGAGSHTYKLAFACNGAATFTILQVGSAATSMPVTMEVYALT